MQPAQTQLPEGQLPELYGRAGKSRKGLRGEQCEVRPDSSLGDL